MYTAFQLAKTITKSIIGLSVTGVGCFVVPMIPFAKNFSSHYLSRTLSDKELDRQRAQLLFDIQYTSDAQYTSIRTDDVNWIKGEMMKKRALGDEKTFTVVVGPKGVGKTSAVKTAVDGLPGVIFISNIPPDTSQDEIIKRVCAKINVHGQLEDTEERALSIIEAYKTISGGQTPILIIPASPRLIDEKPAKLSDAGRVLTKTFKLNVLIDASENAMPSALEVTPREEILEMKPMTDEIMRKLPQFEQLFEYLNETKNDQVVLAVCNGSPAFLRVLNGKLNECGASEKDTEVIKFVEKELIKANLSINALEKLYPKITEVIS
jgi:hypothetical protein